MKKIRREEIFKNMESDMLGRGGQKHQPMRKTDPNIQLAGISRQPVEKQKDTSAPLITRQSSWVDEVEAVYSSRDMDTEMEDRRQCSRGMNKEVEDRSQWNRGRRGDWTVGLSAKVLNKNQAQNDKVQPMRIAGTSDQQPYRMQDDMNVVKNVIDNETKQAIRHWFSDDNSLDESTDKNDANDEEFDTIERKKRNQTRKKKASERKKKRKEDTAAKARNMIGLRPITEKEITEQLDTFENYEIAKEQAVKNHMRIYYKYSQKELDRLEISETKVTSNGDNFIYIAVAEHENIREIYLRKAECKRDDVQLCSFIPPPPVLWEIFCPQ